MTNDPIIVACSEDLGEVVASRVLGAIEQAGERQFLLGSPTGRTPAPVFEPLARGLAERGLDPRRLTVVLMDEYLTDDLSLVDPALEYSCVGYADRYIVDPIRQATGLVPQVWHADPASPADYDRRIAEAGGIDLFLLASGATDGHIAFNQPGAEADSVTRIIELGERTRQDNVHTWPSMTSIDEVPRHGLGVGVGTIVGLSRTAIMMLTGEDKPTAYERILNAAGYEPEWPATAVREIPDHLIVADVAATHHINDCLGAAESITH